MSDTTGGAPAPDAGGRDQGPVDDNAPGQRHAAAHEQSANDDAVVHDDDQEAERSALDGPTGPGTAGDDLGGSAAKTGNAGTMGADAPSGDASLQDADPVTGGDAPGDQADLDTHTDAPGDS